MNAHLTLHPLHAANQPDTAADTDPQESAEWREAFLALAAAQGPARARFLLDELARLAREQRVGWTPELATPYVNTVGVDEQPVFPGDLALEERLASLMRWNALAMVVRANQAESGGSSELGGHIASMRVPPICSRPVSTISFMRAKALARASTGATWYFFSRTARPGCMPAPTWKAVSARRI